MSPEKYLKQIFQKATTSVRHSKLILSTTKFQKQNDEIRKYTKANFLTLNREKNSSFYHNTIQFTQLSYSKSRALCYRFF